jgi:hypothetical protein
MQESRARGAQRLQENVRSGGGLLFAALLASGSLQAQESVLDQLKSQFIRDQGVLRLVVLVSPTCPECVSGAEWVDDYVLKRYPELPLRVYAVWYEMYPGDSPDDFAGARQLMPDRRVTHWWDPNKEVGRWFRHVAPTNLRGEIQWDAFYLYGEQAAWGEEPPSQLLTWGRTILRDRRKLAERIEQIAGPPKEPVLQLIAPPKEP